MKQLPPFELREQCQSRREALKACSDEQRRLAKCSILEMTLAELRTPSNTQNSTKLRLCVEGLLARFAEEKCRWIIEGKDGSLTPFAQGAIRQMNETVPQLCQLLSSRWRNTNKQHGQIFRVYQALNSWQRPDSAERRWYTPRERWCWYQEVAIVAAPKGSDPLTYAYDLTAKWPKEWQHHDMLWYRPDAHSFTGLDDILVSLLTGENWLITGQGISLILNHSDIQRKAIRACQVLTKGHEDPTIVQDAQSFFKKLEIEPPWIGDRSSGGYHLTYEQHDLLRRLEPDLVPNLGDWYQESEA